MGIHGIGSDLIELERFGEALDRHGERMLERLFTEGERAYCETKRRPLPHFAARFAAKEAVAKALGTGIGRHAAWREIEVTRGEEGVPGVRLHGAARDFAAAAGIVRVHLSLSHSRGLALAQALAERASA